MAENNTPLNELARNRRGDYYEPRTDPYYDPDQCPDKDKPEICPHCGQEITKCCYIVGACLGKLGLPQNSPEMTAMKTLAQDYILKSFSGKRDYVKYQKIGPAIVQAIKSQGDSREVWNGIYEKLQEIVPSVNRQDYVGAHQNYKSLVFGLETQFLN